MLKQRAVMQLHRGAVREGFDFPICLGDKSSMISLLRQALARHPFQAVTLVMVDGETLTIQNSEFASVLRRAGLLYLERPEDKEPRFLNLLLVKEVRTKDFTPDFQE